MFVRFREGMAEMEFVRRLSPAINSEYMKHVLPDPKDVETLKNILSRKKFVILWNDVKVFAHSLDAHSNTDLSGPLTIDELIIPDFITVIIFEIVQVTKYHWYKYLFENSKIIILRYLYQIYLNIWISNFSFFAIMCCFAVISI